MRCTSRSVCRMVCVQEMRGGAEALSIFARERDHKSICGAPLDNGGSGYLDPETLQKRRLDRFYHIMKESDITLARSYALDLREGSPMSYCGLSRSHLSSALGCLNRYVES